jgi:hypothetical protein
LQFPSAAANIDGRNSLEGSRDAKIRARLDRHHHRCAGASRGGDDGLFTNEYLN